MAEESYSDFVKSVQDLLRNNKTVEASSLFSDSKNTLEIKNNSWDLIPVITEFLTADCAKNNSKVFRCCVKLINTIASNSNPEEALLQLIEEIEEGEDDTKFITLLKPLQKVMVRIPAKRLNSLAWSFNSIQTFLNKCEVPQNLNLVGKEKLLLDAYKTTQRITGLYSELLIFYENLIKELTTNKEDKDEQYHVVRKFLIQLLGKPLVYLDMEIFDNIKSKARVIAEKLVHTILKISGDPVILLELQNSNENNELMKPSASSLAAFFYLIYSEGVFIEYVPKVYSPFHFFQNSLHLASVLLDLDESIVVEKGLQLTGTLLEHVKFHKLPYLMLDSEDHSKFCKSLSKVIIYNQLEAIRKSALNMYKRYLLSFEIHGFYLLIYNLMQTLNHAGLIGFTITLYKDVLADEFLNNESNMSIYCKGQKLTTLLRKFCTLRENEESDLIEMYDQIMVSLNLLRYLTLRDKNNITGIWDFVKLLEELYFKPMRKGIDLSRAHYKLKIKQLEEETASGDKKDSSDGKISIVVGGQNLEKMPKYEKLKVLYSSLTAFDIMESLLTRLIECIESSKH